MSDGKTQRAADDAGEHGMHGIGAVRYFLQRQEVPCEVIAHEQTFAAASEANAAGIDPRQTAKTVLLHDREGLRAAVIPASERLDLTKARALLGGTSHLRLATEEEIEQAFPIFDAGALPPFAMLLVTPEVVDRQLMEHERILCSGGDHRHSVLISPRALERLGSLLVGDICEDPRPAPAGGSLSSEWEQAVPPRDS